MVYNIIDIERLIQDKSLTLLKSSEGEIYVANGQKVYPPNDQSIEDMLYWEHKNQLGKMPKRQQLKDYIHHIEVLARQNTSERRLHLRVAKEDQDFYYDLGESAVKVGRDSWEVISSPPVYFKCHKNKREQIAPQRNDGVKLKDVLEFINLMNDKDKILFMVYLVTCFVPDIAHPIPNFYGEKGAAKSTALRLLRKLVDPAKHELMVLPRSQNELAQLIAHNYMPAFDNLSTLSPSVSDLLCCAVTGGAVHKRKLYTDTEDIIISVKSCITLNGVNLAARRSDLLDRMLLFEVMRIGEEQRQTEETFWKSFKEKQPFILGAIFDVLVEAKCLMTTDLQIEKLPRMADFAKWGYAIAEAAGIGGKTFLDAYSSNISMVNDEVVASDPVADAIVRLVEQEGSWNGYTTELLTKLREQNPTYSFPKMPNAVSRHIREITSNLRAKNVECTFGTNTNKNKTVIELKRINTSDVITAIPGEAQSEGGQIVEDSRTTKDTGDAGDESPDAA
ncbi:hypothetical protein [Sporomusa sphaeroides]|uniref:ATP-binding protein n=1 Tax=Sporomusa sphaeroides DSM 2875 TaxID=1337886 RepID=A0ABM9VZT8_9FIRM|nr:hypothetical protein [Sporomusa sphaeroides]OLS56328.1 hypothetical protein SPSPH_27210 [Sporomusa sphaeroides DSM 2875]CVK18423.1 hypothetical protein SSPH_01061 [Sporomusa sphaeroides DSM 2875]